MYSFNPVRHSSLDSDQYSYRSKDTMAQANLPADVCKTVLLSGKCPHGDECKYKHVTDEAIAEAATWLRELDD